jgi:hypothetical protein
LASPANAQAPGVSATSPERGENRDYHRKAGVRGNEQVVQLIEFWVTRMKDAGRLKRNKYVSRGATSQEGSRKQGGIVGLGREKANRVYITERRVNE